MSPTVPAVHLTARDGAVDMPLLGLGTWQARGEEAYRMVRTALELGYRHLDTATMYGNEAEIGRALTDSGLAREDVFVTTKCPPERVGREDETLERSLSDLALDHVDLWLVHWPPRGDNAGVRMWERVVAAQEAGRARAIGVSNYSPDLIDELVGATGVSPAVDQVPWSPSDHDAALVDALRERGVVLEGYSPFKRTDMDDPVLAKVAAAHDATPQQVVLRWHVQHGYVVIPKSVHADRLEANLAAADLDLTDEEMAAVDALGS
ncbi:aldo/keto reductase [Georgenia halophila]|uniref:Aldo/keto reductase n=1 Tax=Georgenia halophila TaxID=620889 RepID=A0ABP8L0W4_9MICO